MNDVKCKLKKYPSDLSVAIRKTSRLTIETTAHAFRRLIARSGDEFSGTNEHLVVSPWYRAEDRIALISSSFSLSSFSPVSPLSSFYFRVPRKMPQVRRLMGTSSISMFGPLNGPIYVAFWSWLRLWTATRFDSERASLKFTEIQTEAKNMGTSIINPRD
jgi:hypothetical protein